MAALEAEHYLQEIGSQEGKTDWWVPVRVQPMVGSSGWVVDPDILGSSPLGEFPWITWYTILAGGIVYPFKKLFKQKKKKTDWWAIFNQGQELSPKQWHFTMSLLDALIDSYIMLHLFSAVNFSWLIGFDNL